MLPLSANVPPPKPSVPPVVTLNKPAHVTAQLPPPEKFRVPTFAFTVPVLLNATLTVSATPPVIWKVPALLNVLVPTLLKIPLPLPPAMVQVAPARLLITAPFRRNRLLPVVPLAAVVPEMLSVRVSRMGWPEGRLIPPLPLTTPVPLIVPPVQVRRPLTFTAADPLRVPPVKFNVEIVAVPPGLLKLTVPAPTPVVPETL